MGSKCLMVLCFVNPYLFLFLFLFLVTWFICWRALVCTRKYCYFGSSYNECNILLFQHDGDWLLQMFCSRHLSVVITMHIIKYNWHLNYFANRDKLGTFKRILWWIFFYSNLMLGHSNWRYISLKLIYIVKSS